ncbi:hypothetical protein [Streptomyces sp. NPDC008137]
MTRPGPLHDDGIPGEGRRAAESELARAPAGIRAPFRRLPVGGALELTV